MNAVLEQCPDKLPLTQACCALGLNRSTVYAHRHRATNDEPQRRSRKNAIQPRALSTEEREKVIEVPLWQIRSELLQLIASAELFSEMV